MKKLLTICAVVGLILTVSGVVQANQATLQFDPNDIFNYATSDNTRVNQQGTARAIWGLDRTPLNLNGGGQTARYYQTYNDGASPYDRMGDATAAKDLQSVANILSWGASFGHQGVCWMQLYLQGPNEDTWGGKVVLKSGSMSPSVNGEYLWTTELSGATPTFNTNLGGDEASQQAISSHKPADELWSVTADFFVDENGDGLYDGGDSDVVLNDNYTIWFYAKLNNWTYDDDYTAPTTGGNPGYIEGTLIATAVPEPATMGLLALGGLFLLRRRNK